MLETLLRDHIVVGSRIQLRRNLFGFPFAENCSAEQRQAIQELLQTGFSEDSQLKSIAWVQADDLETAEFGLLTSLDSQLNTMEGGVSNREFLATAEVQTQLLVNHEDHLCLNVTRADGDLESSWKSLTQLDDLVESRIDYAFDPRWGYLTACPANMGTGLRAYVMVHLPALALTSQIDKVFRTLHRVDMNARGVFGNTSAGHFYRIGNQQTLGRTEGELVEQVCAVIPALIEYETQARQFLEQDNAADIQKRVDLAVRKLVQLSLSGGVNAGGGVWGKSRETYLQVFSLVRLGIGLQKVPLEHARYISNLVALNHIRKRIAAAVASEDYHNAAQLRDQVTELERLAKSEIPTGLDPSSQPELELESPHFLQLPPASVPISTTYELEEFFTDEDASLADELNFHEFGPLDNLSSEMADIDANGLGLLDLGEQDHDPSKDSLDLSGWQDELNDLDDLPEQDESQ